MNTAQKFENGSYRNTLFLKSLTLMEKKPEFWELLFMRDLEIILNKFIQNLTFMNISVKLRK